VSASLCHRGVRCSVGIHSRIPDAVAKIQQREGKVKGKVLVLGTGDWVLASGCWVLGSEDLLLTQYLKVSISYYGISKVETFPFPEPALREALMNSIKVRKLRRRKRRGLRRGNCRGKRREKPPRKFFCL